MDSHDWNIKMLRPVRSKLDVACIFILTLCGGYCIGAFLGGSPYISKAEAWISVGGILIGTFWFQITEPKNIKGKDEI